MPDKQEFHLAYTSAHPPRPEPLTRDEVRSIFMAHGFTIKPGNDDLKAYVYEAAQALEAAIRAKGAT